MASSRAPKTVVGYLLLYVGFSRHSVKSIYTTSAKQIAETLISYYPKMVTKLVVASEVNEVAKVYFKNDANNFSEINLTKHRTITKLHSWLDKAASHFYNDDDEELIFHFSYNPHYSNKSSVRDEFIKK